MVHMLFMARAYCIFHIPATQSRAEQGGPGLCFQGRVAALGRGLTLRAPARPGALPPLNTTSDTNKSEMFPRDTHRSINPARRRDYQMLNGCCLCLSHRCVPGTRNLRYLYTSRLLTLLLSRLVYNGAAAIRPITVFISCSLLRNSPPGGGEAVPSVLRAAAGVPFWNKRMKSSARSVSGKKKVPLGRVRPGGGGGAAHFCRNIPCEIVLIDLFYWRAEGAPAISGAEHVTG